MRIPLVGSSYKGVSVALDSARTINMMEEFADSKDAAAPSALIATPGLAKIPNVDGTSISFNEFPIRGMFNIPDNSVFLQGALVVAGNVLYRLEPQVTELLTSERLFYTKTTIGTMETESAVVGLFLSYMRFAASPSQVLLTGGRGHAYIYTIASAALSAAIVFDATPGSYVPLIDIVYLAGYFIGTVNAGTDFFRRIYYSTINDGTLWSAADYFTFEETGDSIKKLMVKNGELWVFTDGLVTRFSPTGDANNPFAPILGSTLDRGCLRSRSVQIVEDSIFWLGSGHNRSGMVVYRSNGNSIGRVSRGFAESKIQEIFEAHGWLAIDDVICSSSVERGHALYKMHFHRGKTTLVYDVTTNKWHERGWWNVATGEYEEEIGWVQFDLNHMAVVGDRRIGLDAGVSGIYELSERLTSNDVFYQNTSAHTDGTDTFIRRERISPTFSHPSGGLVFCNGLELLFETGKANANDPGANPKVSVYVSNDGGNTWGSPRIRSIGKVGKYKDSCRFSGLGSAYKMTFKIAMTDPIGWKLVSAVADLELAA